MDKRSERLAAWLQCLPEDRAALERIEAEIQQLERLRKVANSPAAPVSNYSGAGVRASGRSESDPTARFALNETKEARFVTREITAKTRRKLELERAIAEREALLSALNERARLIVQLFDLEGQPWPEVYEEYLRRYPCQEAKIFLGALIYSSLLFMI